MANSSKKQQVTLRKYPYPYRAMLAICSDLDETPNKEIYFETARYLNTTETTLLGKGVGLEVGNTIYFDMPEGQFSYTNTDDEGRGHIHQLIDSGHIDCLHSFGDFVDSRDQINSHWTLIQKGKRKIEVWVDHAQAPTNIDDDIMQGGGAVPGNKAYHTDLTCSESGLKFIWKGRVTSIIAQNTPRSYRRIFNFIHPFRSCKTILLEVIKSGLAHLGNVKYAMHKDNNVLRQTRLFDGRPVLEFMRSNPSWAGVSVFDSARGIDKVLTRSMLEQLVKKAGSSVLYSHLGKVFDIAEPFHDKTRNAFELLASFQNKQQILVATTRRLLGYQRTIDELSFEVISRGEKTLIYLQSAYVGEDLNGLTWYVEDPKKTSLYINNTLFADLQINPRDETGRASVSTPWRVLSFPNVGA